MTDAKPTHEDLEKAKEAVRPFTETHWPELIQGVAQALASERRAVMESEEVKELFSFARHEIQCAYNIIHNKRQCDCGYSEALAAFNALRKKMGLSA